MSISLKCKMRRGVRFTEQQPVTAILHRFPTTLPSKLLDGAGFNQHQILEI